MRTDGFWIRFGAISAVASVALYASVTVLGASLRPDYSHIRDSVSELIEIGAPNKVLLDTMMGAYHLLLIPFAYALHFRVTVYPTRLVGANLNRRCRCHRNHHHCVFSVRRWLRSQSNNDRWQRVWRTGGNHRVVGLHRHGGYIQSNTRARLMEPIRSVHVGDGTADPWLRSCRADFVEHRLYGPGRTRRAVTDIPMAHRPRTASVAVDTEGT